MATARKEPDPSALYELKQRAIQYYAENGVPQRMEEILNSMFRDNPDDVYGHLANYFESFSKTPVITEVKAREVLDSKGQPTIQTEVYCKIKNFVKLMSTTVSPTPNSHLLDNALTADKEIEDTQRKESVQAAINIINSITSLNLKSIDPTKQDEIDYIIYHQIQKLKEEEASRMTSETLDETEISHSTSQKTSTSKQGSRPGSQSGSRVGSASGQKKRASPKGKGGKGAPPIIVPAETIEKFEPGSGSVSAVSVAVCTAAAKLKSQPLYQYLAALGSTQPRSQYRLPLPMVTIMQSGKAALGKLNCIKEFMVVPNPNMPLAESIDHVIAIYQQVIKTLYTKGGVAVKYVNDVGAICPLFDKPEQGLDMLRDAITAIGLTPGEDFYVALNAPGSEILDMEKGKYEVMTGSFKSYDDTVEFWVELLGRYPFVMAIIDPIRKLESEQWCKLCDRLSDRCYMVGCRGFNRPAILKDEELDVQFPTSGIVLQLEQMNTISDLLTCSKKMQDANNQVVLSTCIGETSDDTIADLAVAMNARFLKLGAPCRGERVSKLNRLLQIEAELKQKGQLAASEAFVFPKIELPPPPTPVGDNAEDLLSPRKDGGGKKK